MQLHGVRRVIHGHTHLPGDYTLPGEFPDGLFRHVLPDWSASDSRGGFLRVDGSGWSRLPV
jgi:UDP-2,3-diacylglucosamine pyrophosphatase LpxH